MELFRAINRAAEQKRERTRLPAGKRRQLSVRGADSAFLSPVMRRHTHTVYKLAYIIRHHCQRSQAWFDLWRLNLFRKALMPETHAVRFIVKKQRALYYTLCCTEAF